MFRAILIFCTVFLAIAPQDIGAAQPTAEHAVEPWFTLEGRGEVAQADLDQLDAALREGAAALDRYFDDEQLSGALHAATVRVFVHATANEYASDTLATARSGTRDGRAATYFADIHLLAPSAYTPGLETSIGEPKEGAYFARLAIHELSTVPLELVTRLKPEGWGLRTAPPWFVQGFQEYLGMTCAPDGHAALERRIALVASEPDRVDDAFGLEVRDPYATGAVLVHFLHDRYGGDAVRAVLRSGEPTFGRAMRAELGVDLAGFMADWRAWLADRD